MMDSECQQADECVDAAVTFTSENGEESMMVTEESVKQNDKDDETLSSLKTDEPTHETAECAESTSSAPSSSKRNSGRDWNQRARKTVVKKMSASASASSVQSNVPVSGPKYVRTYPNYRKLTMDEATPLINQDVLISIAANFSESIEKFRNKPSAKSSVKRKASDTVESNTDRKKPKASSSSHEEKRTIRELEVRPRTPDVSHDCDVDLITEEQLDVMLAAEEDKKLRNEEKLRKKDEEQRKFDKKKKKEKERERVTINAEDKLKEDKSAQKELSLKEEKEKLRIEKEKGAEADKEMQQKEDEEQRNSVEPEEKGVLSYVSYGHVNLYGWSSKELTKYFHLGTPILEIQRSNDPRFAALKASTSGSTETSLKDETEKKQVDVVEVVELESPASPEPSCSNEIRSPSPEPADDKSDKYDSDASDGDANEHNKRVIIKRKRAEVGDRNCAQCSKYLADCKPDWIDDLGEESAYCSMACIDLMAEKAQELVTPTEIISMMRGDGYIIAGGPTLQFLKYWIIANPSFAPILPLKKQTPAANSADASRPTKLLSKDSDRIRFNVRRSLSDDLFSRVKRTPGCTFRMKECKDIAERLEAELFKVCKQNASSVRYKQWFRNCILQIKEPKNKGFFHRILSGNLSVQRVVMLEPEQLSSEEYFTVPAVSTSKESETTSVADDTVTVVPIKPLLTKASSKINVIATTTAAVNPASALDSILGDGKTDTTAQHLSHFYDANCTICLAKQKSNAEQERKLQEEKELHREQERKLREEREALKLQERKRRLEMPDDCLSYHSKEDPIIDERDPLGLNEVNYARHSRDSDDEDDYGGGGGGDSPNMNESWKKDTYHRNEDWRSTREERLESWRTGRKADRSKSPSSHQIAKNDDPWARDPIVWHGTITMGPMSLVTSLIALSNPVAFKLREDLPTTMKIKGRIQPLVVFDYLSTLRKTGGKDVIVMQVQRPLDLEGERRFNSMYDDMIAKDRYLVFEVNDDCNIKDGYLLPLANRQEPPAVLLPFDGPGINERHGPMVVCIMIRLKANPIEEQYSDVAKTTEGPIEGEAVLNDMNEDEQLIAEAVNRDIDHRPPSRPNSRGSATGVTVDISNVQPSILTSELSNSLAASVSGLLAARKNASVSSAIPGAQAPAEEQATTDELLPTRFFELLRKPLQQDNSGENNQVELRGEKIETLPDLLLFIQITKHPKDLLEIVGRFLNTQELSEEDQTLIRKKVFERIALEKQLKLAKRAAKTLADAGLLDSVNEEERPPSSMRRTPPPSDQQAVTENVQAEEENERVLSPSDFDALDQPSSFLGTSTDMFANLINRASTVEVDEAVEEEEEEDDDTPPPPPPMEEMLAPPPPPILTENIPMVPPPPSLMVSTMTGNVDMSIISSIPVPVEPPPNVDIFSPPPLPPPPPPPALRPIEAQAPAHVDPHSMPPSELLDAYNEPLDVKPVIQKDFSLHSDTSGMDLEESYDMPPPIEAGVDSMGPSTITAPSAPYLLANTGLPPPPVGPMSMMSMPPPNMIQQGGISSNQFYDAPPPIHPYNGPTVMMNQPPPTMMNQPPPFMNGPPLNAPYANMSGYGMAPSGPPPQWTQQQQQQPAPLGYNVIAPPPPPPNNMGGTPTDVDEIQMIHSTIPAIPTRVEMTAPPPPAQNFTNHGSAGFSGGLAPSMGGTGTRSSYIDMFNNLSSTSKGSIEVPPIPNELLPATIRNAMPGLGNRGSTQFSSSSGREIDDNIPRTPTPSPPPVHHRPGAVRPGMVPGAKRIILPGARIMPRPPTPDPEEVRRRERLARQEAERARQQADREAWEKERDERDRRYQELKEERLKEREKWEKEQDEKWAKRNSVKKTGANTVGLGKLPKNAPEAVRKWHIKKVAERDGITLEEAEIKVNKEQEEAGDGSGSDHDYDNGEKDDQSSSKRRRHRGGKKVRERREMELREMRLAKQKEYEKTRSNEDVNHFTGYALPLSMKQKRAMNVESAKEELTNKNEGERPSSAHGDHPEKSNINEVEDVSNTDSSTAAANTMEKDLNERSGPSPKPRLPPNTSEWEDNYDDGWQSYREEEYDQGDYGRESYGASDYGAGQDYGAGEYGISYQDDYCEGYSDYQSFSDAYDHFDQKNRGGGRGGPPPGRGNCKTGGTRRGAGGMLPQRGGRGGPPKRGGNGPSGKAQRGGFASRGGSDWNKRGAPRGGSRGGYNPPSRGGYPPSGRGNGGTYNGPAYMMNIKPRKDLPPLIPPGEMSRINWPPMAQGRKDLPSLLDSPYPLSNKQMKNGPPRPPPNQPPKPPPSMQTPPGNGPYRPSTPNQYMQNGPQRTPLSQPPKPPPSNQTPQGSGPYRPPASSLLGNGPPKPPPLDMSRSTGAQPSWMIPPKPPVLPKQNSSSSLGLLPPPPPPPPLSNW